jgi:hypothetical protein
MFSSPGANDYVWGLFAVVVEMSKLLVLVSKSRRRHEAIEAANDCASREKMVKRVRIDIDHAFSSKHKRGSTGAACCIIV